jgi:5'-nucleotidase|eukprot:COSAG01_NODE_3293_length_6301_cov_3.437278_3_plen_217_part_00
MGKTVGHLKVDIDARFAMVRTQETTCGNWIADVMRTGCKCDVVLLNSGTLRADTIFPPGKFTLEDLMKLLPFSNELMVVEINGKQLLHALENSVSGWPKKEGRFCQVSGLKFEFDGSRESFSRVSSVMIGDHLTKFEPLDLEKKYSVAALDFAAKGNEGFTMLAQGKVLWDEEVCTPLGTLVNNNLRALEVLNHSSFAKLTSTTEENAAQSFLGRA